MGASSARTQDLTGRGIATGAALLALAVGGLTMTDRALAAAPGAPPSICAAPADVTKANTTPVDIEPPDYTGAVPSTWVSKIQVKDAPSVLRDINIQTFITHSYSGDMEISLISPQDTTVVLKRPSPQGSYNNIDDPGVVGFKTNVFNGTVWDDSVATTAMDKVYVDGVPSGPLAPEGPLSAFIGEDPNGDWTLRVKDVTPGDGGQMTWNLSIAGLGAKPPIVALPPVGLNTPVSVDDDTPASLVRSQEVTVSGAEPYLWDVDLITAIDHEAPTDLDVTLTHVDSGRTVTLTSDNGSTNQGIFNGTRWDDGSKAFPSTSVTAFDFQSGVAAPRLAPEKALGAFIGVNPNGKWRLTVTDDSDDGDGGTLKNWSLVISATKGCDSPPPPVTPPVTTPPPVVLPPAAPPTVTATRLTPRSLGLALSTRRDRVAPYAFSVSGKLVRPAGSTICAGKVAVTLKAGKKTVTQRTVALRKSGANCTYRVAFSLNKKPATLPKSGALTVSARFVGTALLKPRVAKPTTVRIG